mmetsp:Transcript_13508/g.19770  ORF Transcript_13508/g.19770 Transcript_13508/m.19770 type:complete len:596 (+) Transcript_13508:169-1956(+)
MKAGGYGRGQYRSGRGVDYYRTKERSRSAQFHQQQRYPLEYGHLSEDGSNSSGLSGGSNKEPYNKGLSVLVVAFLASCAVLQQTYNSSNGMEEAYEQNVNSYCSPHEDVEYTLERHPHDSSHGDICREVLGAGNIGGFVCPSNCHETLGAGSPYCVMSENGNQVPCRVPRTPSERPYKCHPDKNYIGVCLLDNSYSFTGKSQKNHFKDESCDNACGTVPFSPHDATPQLPKGGGLCASDWDCSLAGVCSDSTKKCVCDDWATGHDCSYLDLQPIPPDKISYLHNVHTSWGASIVYSNHDQLYHMYVSEITCPPDYVKSTRCGLNFWQTQSQVAHATSPTLQGPYVRQKAVVAPFAHNPTVRYSPNNPSVWHMYYISHHDGPVQVITSSDYGQTWSPPTKISPFQNPAPLMKDDGTLWLYHRNDHLQMEDKDSCSDEGIRLSMCSSPTSPCTEFDETTKEINTKKKKPIVKHTAEDPFVFIDTRGNYHMLANALPYKCLPKKQQGGHAWSKDGITWSDMRVGAFTANVQLMDGTTMSCERRERPQLVFDLNNSNKPIALASAVMGCDVETLPVDAQKHYRGGSDSFTIVQLLGSGA